MTNTSSSYVLLAFVGMPGSGKTEAAQYLKEKGYAYVRFGDVTEDVLREKLLPITPENEQEVRETLRQEQGMQAYAEKSLPKILRQLENHEVVVLDGLYSWEEYRFLQEKGLRVVLIHVYTEKHIRYERLATRSVRPLSKKEAFARDIAEIEKLNKSGPIAAADYLIENNEQKEQLYDKLGRLCERLKI
ncbi:MAG: AAA family ATPase [Patescibacteria group bacterium]|nr:AAA family ATPase [Patescibacteria group bacterium]